MARIRIENYSAVPIASTSGRFLAIDTLAFKMGVDAAEKNVFQGVRSEARLRGI